MRLNNQPSIAPYDPEAEARFGRLIARMRKELAEKWEQSLTDEPELTTDQYDLIVDNDLSIGSAEHYEAASHGV